MQKFFRRNFRDEIRDLAVEQDSILPPRPTDTAYPPSAYEGSVSRSVTSSGTRPFVIPPLNLGRQLMTPPLPSPASTAHQTSHSNQTPLARHLAQLTKHGINAVSSAPGELTAADSVDSVESPRNSFMNVATNGHRHEMSQAEASAASIVSGGSFTSSLRGRFSRFGSLNFGRRNQQR
jgi:dedicator of cytokinesis protein 3